VRLLTLSVDHQIILRLIISSYKRQKGPEVVETQKGLHKVVRKDGKKGKVAKGAKSAGKRCCHFADAGICGINHSQLEAQMLNRTVDRLRPTSQALPKGPRNAVMRALSVVRPFTSTSTGKADKERTTTNNVKTLPSLIFSFAFHPLLSSVCQAAGGRAAGGSHPRRGRRWRISGEGERGRRRTRGRRTVRGLINQGGAGLD
jgi:hypothetical protein